MLAPPNEFIRDNGVATGFVCVADRKDRSKGGRCLLRQRFQNSGVGVPLAAVKLCGSGKSGGTDKAERGDPRGARCRQDGGSARKTVRLVEVANQPVLSLARVIDPLTLPDDLPRPKDDGAATHLLGERMPEILLPTTDGGWLGLNGLGRNGPAIIFCYPWTGRPGEPLLVEEWDSIPGARGCTPETCGFRDLYSEFEEVGARVIGLSTQGTIYQAELAQRLQLPFPILSDEGLEATRALRLPTMEVADRTLIKRLTIVVEGGSISKVFYPVFPPDRHASEVLAWLHLDETKVPRRTS